jgi:hypothetical protein
MPITLALELGQARLDACQRLAARSAAAGAGVDPARRRLRVGSEGKRTAQATQ